jgi:hypothetical protein
VAATDDTGPIKLPDGVHRLRNREEGAPTANYDRGKSGLIEQICQEAMDIGRSPNPSETQIAKLSADISTLRSWAQRGLEAGAAIAAAAGGGRGGGVITVVVSVVLAAGVALGIPGLTSSDDAAQAKVLAEQTRDANERQDERITTVERRQQDEERRHRRVQGLTVRWLGDTQEKQCRALQAIVIGINRIAPKRRQEEPIEIDCDAASLPPELIRLVADLEIEESGRP